VVQLVLFHLWLVLSNTICMLNYVGVVLQSVPDLPLCLGVLKHRASLARGPHLPAKKHFTMDFCLCGAILNLKAFCFGRIPDIMIELIAYWSVPQSRQSWQCFSGIETKLLVASGYWQKRVEDGFMLTWCNFKFDDILFNLETYRRM